MNNLFKLSVIAAVSSITLVSVARADHHETSTAQGGKMDAKTFVKKAAKENMAEIKMAQLGMQRAQNQQLKQFATQLHRDHMQASNQLHSVSQQLGVTPETEPKESKEKQAEMMKKLENASNFDREFTLATLKHHVRDVSMYQKAQTQIQDPQVKQFIGQTLPILQQHLTQAKTVAQAVGVDASTIASTLAPSSEKARGGSENLETTEDEEGGTDEGADNKNHQGAGAEQLTEGNRR